MKSEMITMAQGRDTLQNVSATINYLGAMDERPWSDVIDRTKTNIVIEPRQVEIENVWDRIGELSLDREGFTVIKHNSAVTNFRDSEQTRSVYPREMEQVVQRLTGARRVIAKQTPVMRLQGDPKALMPAQLAHSDFTLNTLKIQLKEHDIDLSAPEFAQYSRFCVYQTWRALSGPGQDMPLALADLRSVSAEDKVDALYVEYQTKIAPDAIKRDAGDDEMLEFCLYRPNDKHRWCYFPRLRSDELLVWKGFEADNNQSWAMHSAFVDPTEADAPLRESIETRIYAFF